MPDPTGKTVSASQAAALLDASPYLTRWLLWQHFANGVSIEPDDNARMDWGKRLEPVILAATAEELNLEVWPNERQAYERHPELPLGATVDARIADLNRGPGVVEAKSVDWLIWKDQWTEELAPDHIEIQLQAQMMAVGARWGVISCLVGGNELRLYDREPNEELQAKIAAEALAFFASIDAGEEPDPMGKPDEMRTWRQMRPQPEPEPLILKESEEAHTLLAELAYWQSMASQAKKMTEGHKAKLELMAGDHSEVITWRHVAKISRSQTKESAVMLPLGIRQHLAAIYETPGVEELLPEGGADALAQAISWREITRRAGVTTRIAVKARPTLDEAPWANEVENFLEAG